MKTNYILLLTFLSLSSFAQTKPLAIPQFLTHQKGVNDYWPCFSADGKDIVFSRRTPGSRWQLFRVAAHGSEPAIPFLNPSPDIGATRASTSLNGAIAFTGIDVKGTPSLWTTDSSGRNTEKIVVHDIVGGPVYPSWYANGKEVVTVAYQQEKGGILNHIELLSGKATAITDLKDIRCGMPDVSPDGSNIVFAGQKIDGDRNYDQTKNVLWVLNKTGQLSQQTKMQGRAPKWSPDGKYIAYESTEGGSDGKYAIFIIAADGQKFQRITAYEWDANHPVWSADGNKLAVSAVHPEDPGFTGIAILNLEDIKL